MAVQGALTILREKEQMPSRLVIFSYRNKASDFSSCFFVHFLEVVSTLQGPHLPERLS